MILASVFWSTSGFFVKSPPIAEGLPAEYRAPVLACYRALFASLLMAPMVAVRSIRWRPALVPMVVAFALMNFLFVTALTKTTAAAAIFLQNTATVWASILGRIFLGESIHRGTLAALGGALVGILLIVGGDAGGANLVGNLYATASGFCYAVVVVTLRQLRDEDSAWLVALNHLVSGLVLLPWVGSMPVSPTAVQWTLIALLGMLQMGTPYLLFAKGVRTISAQEAALLSLLEPLLNPLWVWLAWGEKVPPSTAFGGFFILCGLALRYLVFRESATAAAQSEQPSVP